eukprot:m.143473 g.143473  ORF g.143473 m.143473 type:complete len:128 (-) comp14898_c0_seq4:2063-2446(-)
MGNRPKSDAPMEVSSKVRPRARKVIHTGKRSSRDPRFDEMSGTLNREMFEKSYSFINDMKKKEKNAVLKELKATKDEDRKRNLQRLLQRYKDQENAKKMKRKKMEAKKKKKTKTKTSDQSSKESNIS